MGDFTTESLLKGLSRYPVAKGDLPGHVFHGNQYEAGESGGQNEVNTIRVSNAETKAIYSFLHSQRAGSEALRSAGVIVDDDNVLRWNKNAEDYFADAVSTQARFQSDRGFANGVWIGLGNRLAEATGNQSFRWDYEQPLATSIKWRRR